MPAPTEPTRRTPQPRGTARRRVLLAAVLMAVAVALAVGYRLGWVPHGAGGGATHRAAAVWLPITERSFSHGRFERFTVFSPHDSPRGFVLLLSGADGWNAGMTEAAHRLAARGAMVAGIDAGKFVTNLEGDPAQCVFPDGDLENLSRFVQAFYRLPTYLPPLLAGYSAGGTLAYAVLAQAPAGTFGGALSVDFCPAYASPKRLCTSGVLAYVPHTADGGVDLSPPRQLAQPWVALQRPGAGGCAAVDAHRFIAAVPGARELAAPAAWGAPYDQAIDALIARNAPAADAIAPPSLSDLPLVSVQVPAGVAPGDSFAIMLSGDGGWAGLDKEVAAALAQQGIAVVGVDSLRYFWSARTPAGMAADLGRIIRYYSASLGKARVVLIGYSQGADVLPFAVNRLEPQDRSRVVLAAIMGMSEHALFEFHMASWIGDDDSGPPTLPEVDRIGGIPVLCMYGEDEDDSLCPKLDPHKDIVVKLKGGHHFDGNYAVLAQTILGAMHR